MNTSKFSVEAARSMVLEANANGQCFVLTRSAVIEALRAFVEGYLTNQNIAEWADFFDVNENVELESDVFLPDVLFELSSPEINGELDADRAGRLVSILSENNNGSKFTS